MYAIQKISKRNATEVTRQFLGWYAIADEITGRIAESWITGKPQLEIFEHLTCALQECKFMNEARGL